MMARYKAWLLRLSLTIKMAAVLLKNILKYCEILVQIFMS